MVPPQEPELITDVAAARSDRIRVADPRRAAVEQLRRARVVPELQWRVPGPRLLLPADLGRHAAPTTLRHGRDPPGPRRIEPPARCPLRRSLDRRPLPPRRQRHADEIAVAAATIEGARSRRPRSTDQSARVRRHPQPLVAADPGRLLDPPRRSSSSSRRSSPSSPSAGSTGRVSWLSAAPSSASSSAAASVACCVRDHGMILGSCHRRQTLEADVWRALPPARPQARQTSAAPPSMPAPASR